MSGSKLSEVCDKAYLARIAEVSLYQGEITQRASATSVRLRMAMSAQANRVWGAMSVRSVPMFSDGDLTIRKSLSIMYQHARLDP